MVSNLITQIKPYLDYQAEITLRDYYGEAYIVTEQATFIDGDGDEATFLDSDHLSLHKKVGLNPLEPEGPTQFKISPVISVGLDGIDLTPEEAEEAIREATEPRAIEIEEVFLGGNDLEAKEGDASQLLGVKFEPCVIEVTNPIQ